jgi:RNA polymerase sigma-70 factor (ECF subfamily)
MRVVGNDLLEVPVISSMSPEYSFGAAILADQGLLRSLRDGVGSNAVLFHPKKRHSGIDLTMRDQPAGNQKHARFQALCQSLRPDLLRFALWLCRDRAVAEDVVQETLLRAWKAQDALQDEAAAKPWFLTIIRREYARTFERKRLPTVDLDDLAIGDETALAASDEQELTELRMAIFKLPEEYREPLVLQVLMGFSTAEIAAQLNLTPAAVLTRLFRARRQLRVLCGEDTTLDPEE